jgi:hypothetical protein
VENYARPEPDEYDAPSDQSNYEDFLTEAALHQVRNYREDLVSYENAVQNLEAVYAEFSDSQEAYDLARTDFDACLDAVQDMFDDDYTGGEIV